MNNHRQAYCCVCFGVFFLFSIFSMNILLAANPFGEEGAPVQNPTTVTNSNVTTPPDAGTESINSLKTQFDARNKLSGLYKTKILSYPIIKGKISFTDTNLTNYPRAVWLESPILTEHGCQNNSLKKDKRADKVKKMGLFSSTVQTPIVTADFDGRAFVVKAIVAHYGGTTEGNDSGVVTPSLPELAKPAELEKANEAIETEILKLEFEYDDLIVKYAALEQGMFKGGEKKAVEARWAEIKGLIADKKAAMAKNQTQMDQRIFEAGIGAENKGEFQKALSLFQLYDHWDNDSRAHAGNCYEQLKDFNSAIKYYNQISPQTNPVLIKTANCFEQLKDYNSAISYYNKVSPMTADVQVKIANCQHLNGNDKDGLATLMGVLGSYNNSPEQLDALKKIDDWNLLTEVPESQKNVADVYLKKAFLDSGDQAVADYKRTCAIQGTANNSDEKTSSKAIVDKYAATKKQANDANQTALAAASTRFDQEQKQAQNDLATKKNDYQAKFNDIPRAYDEECNQKKDIFERERNQALMVLSEKQSTYQNKLNDAPRAYNVQADAKRQELQTEKNTLSNLQRNCEQAYSTYVSKKNDRDTSSSRVQTLDSQLNSARIQLSKLKEAYAAAHPAPSTDPYSSGSTTGNSTDPYASKPSGSSTDPYASKPSGSSTDPYASKPSGSSTDPYASKPQGSSTDPYANKPSGSNTDPYASKPQGSSTDPYASSSGVTAAQVSAAEQEVARLSSLDDQEKNRYNSLCSETNDALNYSNQLISSRDVQSKKVDDLTYNYNNFMDYSHKQAFITWYVSSEKAEMDKAQNNCDTTYNTNNQTNFINQRYNNLLTDSGKQAFADQYVAPEKNARDNAQNLCDTTYNSSNKTNFVKNDGTVVQTAWALNVASKNFATVDGLAKNAGYQ
ncbi:MAG: hypothetical protein HQM08_14545 [Candidatus Riflebacteria bacterium]|nr:hypothetical protein [Candidatus Riflebacteria bacterium]